MGGLRSIPARTLSRSDQDNDAMAWPDLWGWGVPGVLAPAELWAGGESGVRKGATRM